MALSRIAMIYLYSILALLATPLVLVGVGLPFKHNLGARTLTNGVTITQYELPDWLKWCHNPEDHLTGDKDGRYWTDYFPVWLPAWFKMWWWSGWRNPFNYLKRVVIGIDIRDYTFHKLCGQDYVRDDMRSPGFQILYAKPKAGGMVRPMLYWVRPWGNSTRAIVWQWGWKIKLSHGTAEYDDEMDYFKGLTFEPQLFKDIS